MISGMSYPGPTSGPQSVLRASAPASLPRVAFGGAAPLSSRVQNGAINVLMGVFNRIDSSYLASFMALDVVGLWIERIFTGLMAGRYRYDAQSDPENRSLSPLARRAKSIRKNLQGLNWLNMWEELKREALTAPGCLGLPSLAFVWARWKHRSQAVQLSHASLKGLSETFAAQWQDVKAPLTSDAIQMRLKESLSGLFVDPALRKTPLDAGQDVVAKAYGLSLGLETSYGDFIDRWAQRWSEEASGAISGETMTPAQARLLEKRLSGLNGDLKQVLIEGFHRLHGRDAEYLSRDCALTRLWEPVSAGSSEFSFSTRRRPLGALLQDLSIYKDVLRDAVQAHRAQPQEAFASVLRATQRRVQRSKLAYALVATGLGGGWLLMLPHFVQKSRHYPATRAYTQQGSHPHPPALTPVSPDKTSIPSSRRPSDHRPLITPAPLNAPLPTPSSRPPSVSALGYPVLTPFTTFPPQTAPYAPASVFSYPSGFAYGAPYAAWGGPSS